MDRLRRRGFELGWAFLVAVALVGVLVDWSYWLGFAVLAGLCVLQFALARVIRRPKRPEPSRDPGWGLVVGMVAAGMLGVVTTFLANADDAVRLLVVVIGGGVVGEASSLGERWSRRVAD